MKVAVIGATGPTGQQVVNVSLEEGHEVIAIVRSPEKMTTVHDKLKVVKANLMDSSQLKQHFVGCDAVLSAIGGPAGFWTPVYLYTDIGKAAVTAMRELGIKRLVCVTAWGAKDDPNLPFIWRWVLRPFILRSSVKNIAEFEDYLINECGDINYTTVRPPALKNMPPSSKPIQVQEGLMVTDYETTFISRTDVAKFVLSCLRTDKYDQKMMAVTSRKED